MQNFELYIPTQVIFGKDTHLQAGELIKKLQRKKVLVHYGSQSAEKSGLLDQIFASLEKSGIRYTALGGAVPNPRLSKVYEGIELCRKEEITFILAVGGGSVIDSAKAIGYGVANPEFDVWELYKRTQTAHGCLPLGAIVTIAASGSETSDSSVITN